MEVKAWMIWMIFAAVFIVGEMFTAGFFLLWFGIGAGVAGLLALLRFIDTNKNSFRGVRFEILSDSAVVVYQITQKKYISEELIPSFRAVIGFQKKIPFKISWVPTAENISITGLVEMPSISSETDLNLEIEIKDKNKELGKGYILF